jgi:hypothetical protein
MVGRRLALEHGAPGAHLHHHKAQGAPDRRVWKGAGEHALHELQTAEREGLARRDDATAGTRNQACAHGSFLRQPLFQHGRRGFRG